MRKTRRSSKKTPLEATLFYLTLIERIAYRYQRDQRFIPTAAELALFESLRQRSWELQCTLCYIKNCLQARMGLRSD